MERFLFREADKVVRRHFLPLVAAKDRAKLRETCRAARDSIPNSEPKRCISLNNPISCFLDSMTDSVADQSHEIIARGVAEVISGTGCFAARLHNGNVVTWGNPDFGGDSSNVQHLLQGVAEIIASRFCFAARLQNGNVVTWGHPPHGGDSSDVQHLLHGVAEVIKGIWCFAARLHNGNVVTWGDPDFGGDSSRVQHLLHGIQSLRYYADQFHAQSTNGQIISWP